MPADLQAEALDEQVFGRLVALEAEAPGFLAELIGEFESGVERRVAALREAHRTGDEDGLIFAAHAMRGSCGMIGAARMAALAFRLEYGRPSRAEGRSLVLRLEAEFAEVRRALTEALAGAGVATLPS